MDPVATFVTPVSSCDYRPGQLRQLRYEVHPRMRASDYERRLLEGWRRFGPLVFRPECSSCRMCRSLRVPAATFQPNTSQRRTWARNVRDVDLHIGTPSISAEKEALSVRFHQYGHDTKGWPADNEPDLEVFVANPFRTEEWTYSVGGELLGVGYVDALATGLSAIYFFWDPDHARRALGTFNILAMIAEARSRDLPYVYLGYFVAGCRSLEYKGKFRPNEILSEGGVWEPFVQ